MSRTGTFGWSAREWVILGWCGVLLSKTQKVEELLTLCRRSGFKRVGCDCFSERNLHRLLKPVTDRLPLRVSALKRIRRLAAMRNRFVHTLFRSRNKTNSAGFENTEEFLADYSHELDWFFGVAMGFYLFSRKFSRSGVGTLDAWLRLEKRETILAALPFLDLLNSKTSLPGDLLYRQNSTANRYGHIPRRELDVSRDARGSRKR